MLERIIAVADRYAHNLRAARRPMRPRRRNTMQTCGKCGTVFTDGATDCPKCGALVRQEVVVVSNEPAAKQELKQLLFSFSGRISRKPFWLYFVAMLVPVAIVAGIGAALKGSGAVLLVVAYVFYIWTGLALQVKRWHDRGKSGWWALIGLIPVLGAIWVFVEVGCLRGTVGANAFGGDPTDLY